MFISNNSQSVLNQSIISNTSNIINETNYPSLKESNPSSSKTDSLSGGDATTTATITTATTMSPNTTNSNDCSTTTSTKTKTKEHSYNANIIETTGTSTSKLALQIERKVVVDAGAAIALERIDKFGNEFFTTEEVFAEIRDQQARRHQR